MGRVKELREELVDLAPPHTQWYMLWYGDVKLDEGYFTPTEALNMACSYIYDCGYNDVEVECITPELYDEVSHSLYSQSNSNCYTVSMM